MRWIKALLVPFLFLSNFVFSQEMSISVLGGSKSLLGKSYYSREIGWPGIYAINGTESWFTGLGFKNELNLGFSLDYRVSQSPIGLTFNFNYSPMNGKTIWPSLDLNNLEAPPTYEEEEARMDLYSMGLGCKYFVLLGEFEPFFLVSVLINYFGDVKSYSKKYDTEYFVNSYGNRYGFSIGGGLNYEIWQQIVFNGNIAFEMNNLINARKGEDKFNTLIVLFGLGYRIL